MNLTDNEIMNALDRLKYGKHTYSDALTAKNALDLINRKTAKIENLTAFANEFKDKAELLEIEKSAMQHKIDSQKTEIESLMAMLERSQEKYEIAIDALVRAKTKDIKEFAERLKKIAIEKGSVPIVFVDIDNLVKEMVGEER